MLSEQDRDAIFQRLNELLDKVRADMDKKYGHLSNHADLAIAEIRSLLEDTI